jgi:hypothetical protein
MIDALGRSFFGGRFCQVPLLVLPDRPAARGATTSWWVYIRFASLLPLVGSESRAYQREDRAIAVYGTKYSLHA